MQLIKSRFLSFLKYFCLLPSAFRRRPFGFAQGYGGQVCLLPFLKYFCLLPSAFCLLLLAGCEWSAGGGSDAGNDGGMATWNDRQNFVDFSGSYRATDGGVLVRKFGAGSASTTNTTWTTNSVAGELLATGDGTQTAFSGQLANGKPIPGSLTIVVGGYRISDPSSSATASGTINLTVTPVDGSSGTLNLDTGVWVLTFPAAIASGTSFLAAYRYLSSSTVINPVQGNHGDPIYTFVVYQQGNNITIIDSNNSAYYGYIGNVRTTAGSPIDVNGPNNQALPPTTGPIVAQLYVTGYSQGYSVTITGVLQGTLTSASTFGSRALKATFIESGGYDADINGAAQ